MGQVIATQLAKSDVDSYERVAARRAEFAVRRLRDALGLPLTLVCNAPIPDSLQKSPFRLSASVRNICDAVTTASSINWKRYTDVRFMANGFRQYVRIAVY